MEFLNEKHKERYDQLTKISKKFIDDQDYITAGYMLAVTQEVFDKSTKYINSSGIQFEDLFKKEDLSSGTAAYIKAIDSLFRWKKFDLSDIRYFDYPLAYGFIHGVQIYIDYEQLIKSYDQFQKMIEKIKFI